jgi:hypothetical protein
MSARPLAAALAAAAAVLLVPEVAQGANWKGETRQGRLAEVRTGSDGIVSRARIRYRARCGDGKTLSSGVIFLAPLQAATATDFRDGGVFRFNLGGGERAKATTRIEGGLRQSGRWTGNFRVTVRVTRKSGRFVTNCRSGRVGWKASPV